MIRGRGNPCDRPPCDRDFSFKMVATYLLFTLFTCVNENVQSRKYVVLLDLVLQNISFNSKVLIMKSNWFNWNTKTYSGFLGSIDSNMEICKGRWSCQLLLCGHVSCTFLGWTSQYKSMARRMDQWSANEWDCSSRGSLDAVWRLRWNCGFSR